jgi:hypothetical protein
MRLRPFLRELANDGFAEPLALLFGDAEDERG